MKSIDDLTIGEAREIATTFVNLAPKNSQTASAEPPLRIVILQRGWVFVGQYSQHGNDVTITDAQVIRRWGTSHGLGQLANEGPTGETVLDPAGTVRCHILTIIATLDCEVSAWKR